MFVAVKTDTYMFTVRTSVDCEDILVSKQRFEDPDVVSGFSLE